MIRKMMLVFVLLGLTAALVSCNTVRGIGRDISTAGEAISGAASDDTP